MKTVARRLLWLRITAGISQRRLSLLAGLSNRHVCSLESGLLQGHMRAETVKSLATVLGVPPSWLAYGEGPIPDPAAILAAVEKAEAEAPEAPAAAPAANTLHKKRRNAS